MALVRAPTPRSCVPERCWGQGPATVWGQEPLKHHPMVVRGNFVPGGQGDGLQQKLSPGGASLSPPWAWDPSKLVFSQDVTHGTSGTSLSVWPCKWTRVAPESAERHQGLWHSVEALLWGGQGSLPSLSLLVAVSVLVWNSN